MPASMHPLPWGTGLSLSSEQDFASYLSPQYNASFPLKFTPLPSDIVDPSYKPFYNLPKPPFAASSHLTPAPLDKALYTHHPPPGLGELGFSGQPASFGGSTWQQITPLPQIPFSDEEQVYVPPPLPQLCNDSLSQVLVKARHSYFSLLMDMGIGLATHAKDRPYVSFADLYDKYTSLFSDRVVSLGDFFQLCSFPGPGSSFEFQPDLNSTYPSVRYFLNLAPSGESSAGFLSARQPPSMWGAGNQEVTLGGFVSNGTLSGTNTVFAPLSPPSLPLGSTSPCLPPHMISALDSNFFG